MKIWFPFKPKSNFYILIKAIKYDVYTVAKYQKCIHFGLM